MKTCTMFVYLLLACLCTGCAGLGLTSRPGTSGSGNPGEPGYIPPTPGSVTVTGLEEPWNSLIVGFAPLVAYLGARRGGTALASLVKPADKPAA